MSLSRFKQDCYYKCKYVFNRIQGSYLRVMARPKGFCLGTAVPIASLRSLPRLKNSPPDCFFTPCSNPFGLVEQKNKAAFYDATLSLWPARRDSNPRSSESESAALSSCATGGYSERFLPFRYKQFNLHNR